MLDIERRFDKISYETKILGLWYGFEPEETLDDIKEVIKRC